MKKLGCLVVLIAILIFLTFISIRQGYNTIVNDDWNTNYTKLKVVVQSIAKDSSYMKSVGIGTYTYSFEPIVKYHYKNKTRIDTLIWLRSIEESNYYPGDSVSILINNFDGRVSESVDNDRVGTGIINLLQGLFFLGIAYFIFRYVKKIQNRKIREL